MGGAINIFKLPKCYLRDLIKFLGSKAGLKIEILAKLAYGPPYRFYANEANIYINVRLCEHATVIMVQST